MSQQNVVILTACSHRSYHDGALDYVSRNLHFHCSLAMPRRDFLEYLRHFDLGVCRCTDTSAGFSSRFFLSALDTIIQWLQVGY